MLHDPVTSQALISLIKLEEKYMQLDDVVSTGEY
jgi:hypothetical protein